MKKRTSRTALLLTALFFLAACGQKGPLYLPEPAPTNEQPANNNAANE
ncbi:LPS translocon maturation chaperone LptM [Aliidiomarina celeris]|nr:lipoprotein [Aliidiomarina celeris]